MTHGTPYPLDGSRCRIALVAVVASLASFAVPLLLAAPAQAVPAPARPATQVPLTPAPLTPAPLTPAAAPQAAPALPAGYISTPVGSSGSGVATNVAMSPFGLAAAAGHVYVGDWEGGAQVVRSLDVAGGTAGVVAGVGQYGGISDPLSGPATAAYIGDGQSAVAVDAAGDVVFADSVDCVVERVDHASGNISLVAGALPTGPGQENTSCASTGDGGPASSATLEYPGGLAFDAAGNLYIAQRTGSTDPGSIRRVDAVTHVISTVATGVAPGLLGTVALAVDPAGDLYYASATPGGATVVDERLASNGKIIALAGGGSGGPDYTGAGSGAQLYSVGALALDGHGHLFVDDLARYPGGGDGGASVAEITISGATVAPFAGQIANGANVTGCQNDNNGSSAQAAQLGDDVLGLASDGTDVYIGEIEPPCGVDGYVLAVDEASGTVRVIGGGGAVDGHSGDGAPATRAEVGQVVGVATGPDGELFVAQDDTIRKIDAAGTISTYAGDALAAYDGATTGDGGPASKAFIDGIGGVATDPAGDLYFTDGCSVREVDTLGTISTIAGSQYGCGGSGDGGPAVDAVLTDPRGLTVDAAGNVYVVGSDGTGAGVLVIDHATGRIHGFACGGTSTADGVPATSYQCDPTGSIAIDPQGRVAFGDQDGAVRRVVPASDVLTTLRDPDLGNVAGLAFAPDGALLITLDAPYFVGAVHRLDPGSTHEVRVAGNGSLAPNGVSADSGDGGSAVLAGVTDPSGVAVDPSGNVFVAESLGRRVREIADGADAAFLQPAFDPQTAGGTDELDGSAFAAGENVDFTIGGPGLATTAAGTAKADDTGYVSLTYDIPGNLLPGGYTVTGTGRVSHRVATTTSHLVPAVTVGAPGVPGASVSVSGSGFGHSEQLSLTFRQSAGSTPTTVGSATSDPTGHFSSAVTIPASAVPTSAASLTVAGGYDAQDTVDTSFVVAAPLSASPAAGPVGTTVAVHGSGFPASGDVYLYLACTNPADCADPSTELPTATADSRGKLATSLTIPAVAPGGYAIAAYGSGDEEISGSTPFSVTAPAPSPTTTTLAATPSSSVVGGTVTLTATVVPAAASGTVTFTSGATTLGTGQLSAGKATLKTKALVAGADRITASYAGDGAHAGSTSAVTTVTVKNPTNLTLLASPTTTVEGSPVALTATISPAAATGTITFASDGTTLGSQSLHDGQAALTVSGLPLGTDHVTASYPGDSLDVSAGSNTATVTVTPPPLTATTTTLSADSTTPVAGSRVTFTARVAPTAATGTVTISDGGTALGSTSLSGGTATWSSAALTTGTHSISARYAGDATHASSISAPVTVTVQAVQAAAPGTFVSVAPTRLMDSRAGAGHRGPVTGPVRSRGTVALPVTGGVVAAGASAVVLNVTVTRPTASGYITVFPGGSARPTASNLNFAAGQSVPNLVVAPVGAGGKVDLYNGSLGTVQLVVDVSGYFLGGHATAPGAFVSVAPTRLMDSRAGAGHRGPVTGPVRSLGTVALPVTGGVVAAGASAVVLNVTVTRPTASGYITVFPGGSARPTASNLNFAAGQSVPNLVVAPVGAGGKVDLYNGSLGTVQLVVDVSGYFLGGHATAPGAFVSVAPTRLMDSRAGAGHRGPVTGPVRSLGTVALPVTGGVVAAGASAVVLNVTVTRPTASGYITVFPGGSARPTASNLNFAAGQSVPNLVVAPVGAGGKVDLYNGSLGTVQLVVDVSGYFIGS